MDFEQDYNRIRPYNDSEALDAIRRILKEDYFKHAISYLYGEKNTEKVLGDLKAIKTVSEFQSGFSHRAVRTIIEKTSDSLTCSGLDELDSNKGYLFIANHRDIVLDSAIMQVLLLEHNHRTSQITLGSNLMTSKFIIDVGKINKMFVFQREGSRIQMYKDALLHSNYIKRVITEESESVWIAQRDGRTKDGNDKTQVSLIKMLTMGKYNIFAALKELNIVPVTISYEYEPCDAQKIQEQCISKSSEYKKMPGEDLNSILNGFKNNKGRIHMAFGKVLNPIIDECEKNKVGLANLAEIIASSIDSQVYNDYVLNPVNYIASDLLSNEDCYLNKEYNKQEMIDFTDYVEAKISLLQGDKGELKKMFFEMYAMPLVNKLRLK